MQVLTARRARALVDRLDGRLVDGGGIFVVADDADDVLPPVDVVDKSGRAELAGRTASVDDDLR